MKNGIHFISGMPRSGSTLLAAILRQNPRVHAGITSGMGGLVNAVSGAMSAAQETGVFFDDPRRRVILEGLFDNYYEGVHETRLVFDTGRIWCSKMPLLADLFPKAKVVACVRHAPWVIDSIERLIRQNKFQPSGIFKFEPGGTVYSRAEGLQGGAGMVGFAWNALKEAYYGEHSDKLLLLTYETLTANPKKAMEAVYEFIGEAPFAHDFDDVAYSEDEFDARVGTPGLHRVAKKVEARERKTILPPDLFRRYESDSFWRDPTQNTNKVRIV